MALLRSLAQNPVPWRILLPGMAALWIAPALVGVFGLAVFALIGEGWADLGLGLWFYANALIYSPLFSWIGWLIALPMVWAALRFGWFGWASAAAIGAAAGLIAGQMAQTELALPFGLAALLALRGVLGRYCAL